jgi:signal transduction histidine kinase/CheY-like chemotaxis protein/streptogramin lyase
LYEGVLKVSNENKKFAPPLQYKNKDIFIDEKGVVWIGGPMGLYELNRRSEEIRRYTIIKTDNYSFFNEITAICEDTPAGLWISTMRGLYRFDKESKLFSHPAIRIGTDKWTSLYRDNSGILWLGKEADGDGLYKFDPSSNTVSRFPFDTHTRYKIYKDRITRIYEDSKENLWICTNRGLSKFDRLDNHFTHYFLSEKEVKNHSGEEYTRDVLEPNINSKRFLWVAADSGLYQFDTETGKFSICRLANGQPVNEYISGGLRRIAEDGDGNIWFSCNLGLGKYNPYSKSLHRYFQTDGLQGNTFNTAHFKSNNGEMFFGGPQGVSAFFPVSIKDNPHIPEIVITNMKILNKEARLDSNLSLIRKVIIPHDQNIISIEYAALDFNNPKRNQYIHKLENFDPEWTYTGNKHDVTYTNLDPGEYLFRVKGSNSDGIWNEAGTSLLIIITPPWWQTGPAYTLYILTFALIILATWKVQVNRLHMKHQLEIDHLQTEKLQEVDRIKSHFFANISHEFRTPLTLILSPVEQMLSGEFQGNLKEQYKMIIRNGRRLLLLINQLLDLSKLESGKLKLHAQSTDIIKRTNELVQAFESLAKKNNIALKFMPEIESQLVYVDIEKYETIMNNLLSNAFKFTPEDGEIVVRIGRGEASRSKGIDLFNLSTEEASPLLQSLPSQISNIQHPISNIIKITISNTGSGIPSEKINNIFDRFYQLDDSYTRENEGTGIGLALTKELVELHHGTIEVQCRRGGSQTAPTSDGMYLTTFKVKIPTGKEHLSAGEIAEEVDSLIPNPGSRIVQSDIQFEPQGSSIEHRESKIPSPLILIVEDNPDLRQYICSNLDKHYQVIEAENGEQGFSKATSAIPDLIISDVMMPGMDGFELCSRIKTDERTSHIPLILLTARADQEDKLEGLEIGADDYIIKPFDKKELNIRIKNLLTQRLSLMMRFRSEIGLTAEDIAPTSRDKHITCQILHIVYQHMSDPKFNLEILACELGISQMSLYRKINGLFGQSPGDFVRTIRLKHGAKLLKNNSGNISEIAYEVGFSNPANFSSSFRRQFGMSPRDYLKSIDAT